MAKKVTAIVCGVSWAMFGISYLYTGPPGAIADFILVLSIIGYNLGIISLIALAVMALIDYARRPRKEC